MKEIITRLQENRKIELAKSILESAGYSVKEAEDHSTGTLKDEYKIMKDMYAHRKEFKDVEKESGELRDFLDELDHKSTKYDIYYNRKDRGCTVFYESKEYLQESALDDFWDLYDRDYETGMKLEDIAADLDIDMWDNDTGESEITLGDAERILAVFRGEDEGPILIDEDDIIESIMSACEEISGISRATTFEDEGLLTQNKGFVIRTTDGKKFQFSLLGSYK